MRVMCCRWDRAFSRKDRRAQKVGLSLRNGGRKIANPPQFDGNDFEKLPLRMAIDIFSAP